METSFPSNLTDPQPHRSTTSQIHNLTDTQPHRSTTSQIHNLTDPQPHRSTTSQIHNLTDPQPHRYTTSQIHNLTDPPIISNKRNKVHCRFKNFVNLFPQLQLQLQEVWFTAGCFHRQKYEHYRFSPFNFRKHRTLVLSMPFRKKSMLSRPCFELMETQATPGCPCSLWVLCSLLADSYSEDTLCSVQVCEAGWRGYDCVGWGWLRRRGGRRPSSSYRGGWGHGMPAMYARNLRSRELSTQYKQPSLWSRWVTESDLSWFSDWLNCVRNVCVGASITPHSS